MTMVIEDFDLEIGDDRTCEVFGEFNLCGEEEMTPTDKITCWTKSFRV